MISQTATPFFVRNRELEENGIERARQNLNFKNGERIMTMYQKG